MKEFNGSSWNGNVDAGRTRSSNTHSSAASTIQNRAAGGMINRAAEPSGTGTARISRMVLQMFTRSMTWKSEGMAVVANFASALVLGHMPVRPIALGVATVNFRRRCHDLVFEIGAHLNGGGDVRC